MTLRASGTSSVDPAEIGRFAAQAERWWDAEGPFRELHRMTPLRMGWLRDQFCAAFGRDAAAPLPLRGLRVLDAGCGGGLLAEPLARLGARVTGVDAAPEALEVARRHARQGGLALRYEEGTAESLAAAGERFDAVTALEIVEHVADLESFLDALANLVKPGGMVALSTLNRTWRSYLLGVVAAEYVLGWVPPGTHDWNRFVRPSELVRGLETRGFRATDLAGMVFSPLRGCFVLSRDRLGVNYLLAARKEG